MTIWPPAKRRWKIAAFSAFVVFASVGGVCVHLTQVSTERERTKDRAEAQRQQRALRAEVERMSKVQIANARDMATVKERTAPLAKSPLDVRVTNPEALPPGRNAPGQEARQFPLQKVMIASQEQVNPTKQEAPFATKIVVTTTTSICPTWLELKCNAQVMYATVYMNQGALTHVLANIQRWRSKDGKTVWFAFTDPAFLPETPLVFRVSGKARIVAQSVSEGRPPADAKTLGVVGLQIGM